MENICGKSMADRCPTHGHTALLQAHGLPLDVDVEAEADVEADIEAGGAVGEPAEQGYVDAGGGVVGDGVGPDAAGRLGGEPAGRELHGFEGFSILLFAVFIEIVWIDLSALWQHGRRD